MKCVVKPSKIKDNDLLNLKPYKNPTVTTRYWEDALLFSNGFVINKNPALMIWKFCTGKNTVKEIVDRIVEYYPSINPDIVKRDVTNFVKDLLAKNILIIDL